MKVATWATIAAVASIPILIPAGGRSELRIWRVWPSTSVSSGCIVATPNVDWTVSAVMADTPKRPWAAKTWRSAVMPAPLEGSKPAMVRTMGGFAGRGRASSWRERVTDY